MGPAAVTRSSNNKPSGAKTAIALAVALLAASPVAAWFLRRRKSEQTVTAQTERPHRSASLEAARPEAADNSVASGSGANDSGVDDSEVNGSESDDGQADGGGADQAEIPRVEAATHAETGTNEATTSESTDTAQDIPIPTSTEHSVLVVADAANAGHDDADTPSPAPGIPKLAPDWRQGRTAHPNDEFLIDEFPTDEFTEITDINDLGAASDGTLGADAFVELLDGSPGNDTTQLSALGETNQAHATSKAGPESGLGIETEAKSQTQAESGTQTETDTKSKARIFYGWVIVAAVFVILTVSSGIGFYNASVILSAAIKELDASVGSISGATGMFFAISGLTGFGFSKLLEKLDIRWFYLVGGLIGAAALVSLRWVTSVPQLYAFFALFGVAFGMTGLVPSTTLVTRWFDRRRSIAISIASTGLSLGGIVLTPVSAWLIDRRTLAGASHYLALIWVLGIIPVALLILRSHPSEKGLNPDGETSAPATEPTTTEPTTAESTTAEPPATEPTVSAADGLASTKQLTRQEKNALARPAVAGLDFATARTTRFFIALCAAYAVIFFGQVGAIAQLFNMVVERTDNATAATALSVLAFSSVVSRLVGGALVLRLSTKMFTAMLTVLQAVALVLLASADSPATLILTSAFMGMSIGNLLMLQPLLLAEAFGVANYGRIYSLSQLFGTFGVAGGPLALGLLRDSYDYRVAFLVAAAASIVGFLFIISAGPTEAVQSLWKPAEIPNRELVKTSELGTA